MAYQTIFFDLDGTLIDPKFGITKSVQYALSQYGINEELNTLIPFIGPPMNKSFEKYYNFDEKKALEAVTHYRKYFAKHGIHEAIVYEGVHELLTNLKKKKRTLYVVTSKYEAFANALITQNKLTPYFDAIIAANPRNAHGDKEGLIRHALSSHPQKNKKSFVMVGDTEYDILGANVNSIDSIAVTYGYGSKKELQNSNPTHLVNTIEELEDLLTNTH